MSLATAWWLWKSRRCEFQRVTLEYTLELRSCRDEPTQGIAGGLVASIGLCKANFFSSPLRKLRASRHGLGLARAKERLRNRLPTGFAVSSRNGSRFRSRRPGLTIWLTHQRARKNRALARGQFTGLLKFSVRFGECAVKRCWFSVGANPTRQLGHSGRPLRRPRLPDSPPDAERGTVGGGNRACLAEGL